MLTGSPLLNAGEAHRALVPKVKGPELGPRLPLRGQRLVRLHPKHRSKHPAVGMCDPRVVAMPGDALVPIQQPLAFRCLQKRLCFRFNGLGGGWRASLLGTAVSEIIDGIRLKGGKQQR